MVTNVFWNLIVILGCAILVGLIGIILTLAWVIMRFVSASAKEAWKECSAAKDVPIDMSAVTNYVKNTDEKKPSTDE